MGQRRIAFAPEEQLLLTVDRGSVIAYEPLDGSIKWTFTAEGVFVISVVYASTAALPSDVAAGPWRSPSSASTAVALDSKGVLHALDAVLGRELGTIAHPGEPVTLASGGDALAVAFEDRVVVYRAGAKYEIAKRASALAFSRDALTLALGTSKGDLFFVDLTQIHDGARAVTPFEPEAFFGSVSNVVARPGGGWLVSSDRGLTAAYEKKNEKQLNGMVLSAAVDPAGKRLAVHRSEANVVLYEWPPTVPVGRVNASGGTIHDIAFGPDDKLGVAMAGGGAAIVDPTTYAVHRTARRPDEPREPWLVSAESEEDRQARTEEQARRVRAHEQKSGVGARLGIGGLFALAGIVIRLLVLGARASTPTWTPPPDFGNVKLPSETCDHDCMVKRLEVLEAQCRKATAVDCAANATSARRAFEDGDCAKVRELLMTIENDNRRVPGRGDALVGSEALLARLDLPATCHPPRARFSVMRLASGSQKAEVDDQVVLEDDDDDVLWAAPDGMLFLATRNRTAGTCNVRRQVERGEAWITNIDREKCTKVALFGRSSSEVYLSLGGALRRFDGLRWGPPLELPFTAVALSGTTAPGSDIFVIDDENAFYRIDVKTFTEAKPVASNGSARALFGGPALWALGETDEASDLILRWNGKDWTRRTIPNEGGALWTSMDLWASPGGHVFVARYGLVERSTNDGATWTESMLAVAVVSLWGRSNTDVYATGGVGTYHFDGKSWRLVDATPAHHVTGDAKDVFIIGKKPSKSSD